MTDKIQDFGTANGWDKIPKPIKECRKKKHQTKETNLGRCYNEYRCEICGYIYRVDSSN